MLKHHLFRSKEIVVALLLSIAVMVYMAITIIIAVRILTSVYIIKPFDSGASPIDAKMVSEAIRNISVTSIK